MNIEKVTISRLLVFPTFCHAVIAGNFVYVSGTLGTLGESEELMPGGTGPQTLQALSNIEMILHACDTSWANVTKVNVFLADMNTFGEMNDAYMMFVGDDPPARITVGKAGLAFDAAVEIDCVAYRPSGYGY